MNAPGEPLASNPLLDFSGLPRFGEITAEHVAAAVDTLLADARATIERVTAAAGRRSSHLSPSAAGRPKSTPS